MKNHSEREKMKTPEQTDVDAGEWEELKKRFYGSNYSVQSEWGIICFSPDRMKDVVGGDKLTYDEYLDILKESGRKARHYFELCYYNCPVAEFKGQIEKKSKGNVCFQKIFVSGMHGDGTFFDGREEHVWMAESGFEQYEVGDCLSFYAEIYRYLKTGNGKAIDYSLRNPEEIRQINPYDLPSDDYLLMQSINQMICEVCMHTDHCYMGMCIAPKWREEMAKSLFGAAKGGNKNEGTND